MKTTRIKLEMLKPTSPGLDGKKLAKYRALSTEAPPIKVDEINRILDGHHRVEVAKGRGEIDIEAVVFGRQEMCGRKPMGKVGVVCGKNTHLA